MLVCIQFVSIVAYFIDLLSAHITCFFGFFFSFADLRCWFDIPISANDPCTS
jgi:hypothetical protein